MSQGSKIATACAWCSAPLWRYPSHMHPQVYCNPTCHDQAQRAMPYAQRFWAKVVKGQGEDCWIWVGKRFSNGYGVLRVHHRNALAHRAAWELTHGAIPDGLLVCHHCDTPACVRPDHLFLGTASDNARDMVNKGRRRWTRRPSQLPLFKPRTYTRVTPEQVREIRRLAAACSVADLATRFAITPRHVTDILRRVCWKKLD